MAVCGVTSGRSSAVESFEGAGAVQVGVAGAPPPPEAAGPGHHVEAWTGSSTAALEKPLTRSLDNLLIGHDDVATVLDGLSRLDPGAFSDTVGELSAHGKLSTFLDHADPQQRAAFLSLAADKGLLEPVPGHHAEGPLQPPSTPATYRMSVHLPGEVNEAIHADARHGAAEYAHAYAEYSQRYADAASHCATAAELRALGPHAPPLAMTEVVDPKDPSASRYQREWSHHAFPSDKVARDAVESRRADLVGERSGTWLEGRARLAAGTHLTQAKWDTGAGVKEQAVELAAGQRAAQHHGEALVLTNAEVEGVGRLKEGTDVTVETKGGHLESVAVRAGGYGVSLSEARLGFSAPITHGLTATTFADPEAGAGGAGFRFEHEFGTMGAIDVSMSVGSAGVSRATAREVGRADSVGFFDRPPELARGVAWTALDVEVLARVKANGWTEAEWSASLSTAR